MAWVADETRVVHTIFGKGTFKGYEKTYILVDFDSCGLKKLSSQVVVNGLLKQDKSKKTKRKKENVTTMPTEKQFNKSDLVISGINVAEGTVYEIPVFFNETYYVIGSLNAPKIYGSYNLTVIGDIKAEELDVKGTLHVMGTVSSSKIICGKNFICSETVMTDELSVGGNLTAGFIKVKNCDCGGNVLVQSVADIAGRINIENICLVAEGIVGQGAYSSIKTVTGEYFDFDGDISGSVIDLGDEEKSLEMETITPAETIERMDLEESLSVAKEKLKDAVANYVEIDDLVSAIDDVASLGNMDFADWGKVIHTLQEISEGKSIDNLKDYLIVCYADHILPKQIQSYSGFERVFSEIYEDAKKRLSELPYRAADAADLAFSIKVVEEYGEDEMLDVDEIMDKIFQSIGIKYTTVKSFFSK